MLDLRTPTFGFLQQYDVKPAGPIADMMPGQILRSQPNQFFLLLPMDRINRSAKFMRPARFDFDKYENGAVFGNQIEFSDR